MGACNQRIAFHCIVVERKELITKMKSMLTTNENKKTKDENARKLFVPKLSTTAD